MIQPGIQTIDFQLEEGELIVQGGQFHLYLVPLVHSMMPIWLFSTCFC